MFCGGLARYGLGASGGGFTWMFIFMGIKLLAFAILIFLAVKLFNKYTDRSNNIMNVLDEKFASGEISEEDYLKRKTILSKKN